MSPGDSIDNAYNVEHYPYSNQSIPLKKLNYSFLDILSFSDQDFIPQGVCITEDYYLITAYKDIPDSLGALMVYDKHSGEHLLSLALDSNSHLGGVAYDGENVWICNSNKNTIEHFSYDILKFMSFFHSGKIIDIRNMMEEYPVNCIPSGITYYNRHLWIVSHNVWMNSYMQEYEFDKKKNELVWQNRYNIPAQVQGVAFDENGEVYFSISYGRRNSSFIKKYASLNALNNNPNNYREEIEMPPCSEQLWYEDGKLYVLFESASRKYKEGTDGLGQSLCPLDRILVIDLASP